MGLTFTTSIGGRRFFGHDEYRRECGRCAARLKLDGRSEEVSAAAEAHDATSAALAGARSIRRARSGSRIRALLWKGRKSVYCSGGAITPLLRSGWVVSRSALPAVLAAMRA